jgi:hypothetical protein
MLETAFGMLVGLGACILFHLGLSMHARRTRMLKHYRARFFEDAEHLMKQDHLTDDQLSRLQRMIGDLDSSIAFHALKTVVAAFDADERRNGHNSDGRIVSPEWASLVYSYFLALTYLYSIRGWVVRAMLANIFDPRSGPGEAEAIDMQLHGSAAPQRA